jgi:hypothetical protein
MMATDLILSMKMVTPAIAGMMIKISGRLKRLTDEALIAETCRNTRISQNKTSLADVNKRNNNMTRKYNRSEVISFFELTEDQQALIIDNYYDEIEDAENDSYVLLDEETPLPLGSFMRIENSVWSGVYGTSYFSAYYIKLSKCGTCAVVADRYF